MSKTSKLYESPVKNDSAGRCDTCVCCGKRIKNYDAPGSVWVHMNTGWKAVDKSIEEQDCEAETGSASQGMFPIGKDCAKHMHKDFIIVMQ